jgi:CO dehydrogenase maturation factor
MKISISGKGGSGKTTVAGTLARVFARQGFAVLAIDGDSNPNLGIVLGLAPEMVNEMPALPRDLTRDVVDDDGTRHEILAGSVETIAAEYGALAPDGVRLLTMARVEHAGAG